MARKGAIACVAALAALGAAAAWWSGARRAERDGGARQESELDSAAIAAPAELVEPAPPPTSTAAELPDAAREPSPAAAREGAAASDARPDAGLLARVTLRVSLPPGSAAPADDPWRGVAGFHAYPERARDSARSDGVTPCVDGAIELENVEPGVSLLLGVEHPHGPRWSARVEPLAPGERREVDARLERGASVSGVVLDARGAPLAGATVLAGVLGDPWGRRAERASATTDHAGAFRFDGLAPARLELAASGSFAGRCEAAVDARDGDVAGVELRVVPHSCLRARVAWRGGGEPSGGRAEVRGPKDAAAPLRAGAFELCELPPGEYSLEVRAWSGARYGRARVETVRVAGEPVELDLALDTEPTIEVRCTVADADGQPMRDADVRCVDARGESRNGTPDGEAGSFVLRDVAPGRVMLFVSAPGHGRQLRELELDASGPATPRFVLARLATVRGLVLDPSGAPVFDADVAGPAGTEAETDGDGRFALELDEELPILWASAEGHAPSEPVDLDARPGGAADDVVLRLREPCRVRGRVLGPDGRPLAGARVERIDTYADSRSVTTDPHGAFELTGLPPGEARIVASDGDAHASALARLAPSAAAEVELRFEAADPVRLVALVTRGGTPLECELALVADGYAVSARTDRGGRAELELRRPGPARAIVTALDADGRKEPRLLELDVPDAESHALEIEYERLERGGR